MENGKCDLIHANGAKEKKLEVIDGYTIKYHANGKTIWSKGKMVNDQPEGYWEWYRPDGVFFAFNFYIKTFYVSSSTLMQIKNAFNVDFSFSPVDNFINWCIKI